MHLRDEYPCIGHIDVEPAALESTGEPLTELLARLGAELDESSAVGAPRTGWRVLQQYPRDNTAIGAPVDREGRSWRVAWVGPSNLIVHIAQQSFPLRPSRATRRRGLELRWPSVMTADPPAVGFFVDVANVGEHRWIPDGESFFVAGTFVRDPAEAKTVSWTITSGNAPSAVPLDPGDSTRVPVRIPIDAWAGIGPGRFFLEVALGDLGLKPASPLAVELSEEMIERHRRRERPAR